MTIGGFTEWAHLRLRDHRPGPMSYVAAPCSIPQRSILMKYSSRLPEAGVGPGEYQIPTTIGQCRSTVFGPPLPATTDDQPYTDWESEKKVHRRKTRSRPPPLPKQYSLALTPDTPRFTMYGKLHEKLAVNNVGPGDYAIPSMFGESSKGPHMGQRTKLLTSRDVVPGPASYDIPRFGDEKPKRKEYITSVRKMPKVESGPGPGSYDDPTTIAARLAPPKQRLYEGPLFGGRHPISKSGMTVGPGPAQYGDVSRSVSKNITHTPVFRTPTNLPPRQQEFLSTAGAGPGPGEYVLPSEFDRTCSKGPVFRGRSKREKASAASSGIGPGSYDLGKPPMTSNGFRFAAHPYDPLEISKVPTRAPSRSVDSASAPAPYLPNWDAVLPSKYRAVAGFGIGKRFQEPESGGPLCYNVGPPDSGRATVFYRGDYSRSRRPERRDDGASSYSVENDTIADAVRKGKGITFGIRYPARATHQVCKPYDETTNINCQYDDEVTWMTKLR